MGDEKRMWRPIAEEGNGDERHEPHVSVKDRHHREVQASQRTTARQEVAVASADKETEQWG